MRLSGNPSGGFSLIELMISLSILGLLLALGVPNYVVWITDSQIRNAAESIAGGIRYAQAQAVTQNQPVRFVLNPTTGTGGWVVQLDGAGTTLQTGVFAEGAERVNFNAGGLTTVTYTGLGRIVANTDASATLAKVVISGGVAGSKTLWVVLGTASIYKTSIKICDPSWPSTDPKGCPLA